MEMVGVDLCREVLSGSSAKVCCPVGQQARLGGAGEAQGCSDLGGGPGRFQAPSGVELALCSSVCCFFRGAQVLRKLSAHACCVQRE